MGNNIINVIILVLSFCMLFGILFLIISIIPRHRKHKEDIADQLPFWGYQSQLIDLREDLLKSDFEDSNLAKRIIIQSKQASSNIVVLGELLERHGQVYATGVSFVAEKGYEVILKNLNTAKNLLVANGDPDYLEPEVSIEAIEQGLNRNEKIIEKLNSLSLEIVKIVNNSQQIDVETQIDLLTSTVKKINDISSP